MSPAVVVVGVSVSLLGIENVFVVVVSSVVEASASIVEVNKALTANMLIIMLISEEIVKSLRLDCRNNTSQRRNNGLQNRGSCTRRLTQPECFTGHYSQ